MKSCRCQSNLATKSARKEPINQMAQRQQLATEQGMNLKELTTALKTLGYFIRDMPNLAYTQARFVAADQSVEIINGAQAGRVKVSSAVPDLSVPASLLKDLIRGEEGVLEFSADGIEWKNATSKGHIRPSASTMPLMSTLLTAAPDAQEIPLPRRTFDGISWIAARPASPLHAGIIASAYGTDLALSIVASSCVYCAVFPGVTGPTQPVVLPDAFLDALTTITSDTVLVIEKDKARVQSADGKIVLMTALLTVPGLESFLKLLERFDLSAPAVEIPEDWRVFVRRCADILSYGAKDARLRVSPDGPMLTCTVEAPVAKLTTILVPPQQVLTRPIEIGVEALYREFGATSGSWADYISFLAADSSLPQIQCLTSTDYCLKLGLLVAIPSMAIK